MPTEFSFSLSLTALKTLTDLLQLGDPPQLFEALGAGILPEDQAMIRGAVLRDLETRDLAHRGRPESDVEDALTTLIKYRHAVDASGILANESQLCYRVATDGRMAVLARKVDTEIRFETLRPEGLVHAAMAPIGNVKPGPGQSMTFPEAPQEPERRAAAHRRPEPEEGFTGLRQTNPDRSSGYSLQQRGADSVMNKPRKQLGWFTVQGRDRIGRHQTAPPVTWFDTEDGRYMGYRRPGSDGQLWTTCAPADTGRIAQQVIAMLNTLEAPHR